MESSPVCLRSFVFEVSARYESIYGTDGTDGRTDGEDPYCGLLGRPRNTSWVNCTRRIKNTQQSEKCKGGKSNRRQWTWTLKLIWRLNLFWLTDWSTQIVRWKCRTGCQTIHGFTQARRVSIRIRRLYLQFSYTFNSNPTVIF